MHLHSGSAAKESNPLKITQQLNGKQKTFLQTL